MGTHTDDDEPFGIDHPVGVSLGVGQIAFRGLLGDFNLLRGPPPDEHWFAAPNNGDGLADLDR